MYWEDVDVGYLELNHTLYDVILPVRTLISTTVYILCVY